VTIPARRGGELEGEGGATLVLGDPERGRERGNGYDLLHLEGSGEGILSVAADHAFEWTAGGFASRGTAAASRSRTG
jgi:hypothetical protein